MSQALALMDGTTATPARHRFLERDDPGQARAPTLSASLIHLALAPVAATPRAGGAIEVVLTRLDTGGEAARESAALLCDDERRRARQFAFARDRRRFMAARAQLRRLLGARLGVDPRCVEFAYGRRGKPALARRFGAADLRFS